MAIPPNQGPMTSAAGDVGQGTQPHYMPAWAALRLSQPSASTCSLPFAHSSSLRHFVALQHRRPAPASEKLIGNLTYSSCHCHCPSGVFVSSCLFFSSVAVVV